MLAAGDVPEGGSGGCSLLATLYKCYIVAKYKYSLEQDYEEDKPSCTPREEEER